MLRLSQWIYWLSDWLCDSIDGLSLIRWWISYERVVEEVDFDLFIVIIIIIFIIDYDRFIHTLSESYYRRVRWLSMIWVIVDDHIMIRLSLWDIGININMRWLFISQIDGGIAGWSYSFGIYIALIEMNIVIVILMSVILLMI